MPKALITLGSLMWAGQLISGGIGTISGHSNRKEVESRLAAAASTFNQHNVRERKLIFQTSFSGDVPHNDPIISSEFLEYVMDSNMVLNYMQPQREEGALKNIIITGGSSRVRNISIASLVEGAVLQNRNVIVLHTNNLDLVERMAESQIKNLVRVIEQGHLSYNPFVDMDSFKVTELIYESIPQKASEFSMDRYAIKPGARDIIRVICEIFKAQGYFISPSAIWLGLDRTIESLTAELERLGKEGKLTQDRLSEYKAMLIKNQDEHNGLKNYYENLMGQLYGMMNENAINSCDIKSAFEGRFGCAVLLNVYDDSNDLALNLVCNHIKQLVQQNNEFVLVIDGICLGHYDFLKRFVVNNRRMSIVSHDSMVSALGEKKESYDTVGKRAGLVVIHNTNEADHWTKFIGEFFRHEVKGSTTVGRTGIMSNLTNTSQEAREKVPRVPDTLIGNLKDSQACIYDCVTKIALFADVDDVARDGPKVIINSKDPLSLLG